MSCVGLIILVSIETCHTESQILFQKISFQKKNFLTQLEVNRRVRFVRDMLEGLKVDFTGGFFSFSI